jgi:hypothetical protein
MMRILNYNILIGLTINILKHSSNSYNCDDFKRHFK